MRWRRMLVAVCALLLAACAVPHQRDDAKPDKIAAREAEVADVLRGYREVRNSAAELLDSKPLSTVETGALLAIDTGSFEVSQRLAQTQELETGRVEVTDMATPRFSKYPLWFYAVVRDRALGVNRVQIFERTSSADPWLLTSSPQALADTSLPEVRRRKGAAVRVAADDATGMSMSAQAVAESYAAALAEPAAGASADIADDSFIQQMRSTAATNAGLEGVDFSQTWEAERVRYALRTADGGALVFVTFLRQDTYTVPDGLKITWPEGSPQQAFLSGGIEDSGQLNYYHQVLIHLPGGNGKPRALGQYGGVVSGDGGASSIR